MRQSQNIYFSYYFPMSRCFGFRACLVFSFHMFQSWLESSLMKSDRVFNLALLFSLRQGQTMLRRQIESESQQTLPENEGNTEIHLLRMQAAAVCSPAAVTLLAVCVHLCKRSSNLQVPCDRCQGPFPIHLLGGSGSHFESNFRALQVAKEH